MVRSSLGIKSDTDYFSQAGEDAILSQIFEYVKPTESGRYLDIGAYHPYRHSNTYLLYKAGWKGVNVDPNPTAKAEFDKYRKNDVNVHAGIGAADGELSYYIIEESSTMNSFSSANLERHGMLDQVKRVVKVPVFTLSTLVSRFPEVAKTDYMNIDAEGFEMEIISGLDSSGLRPVLITLEQNHVLNLSDVLDSEPCKFLHDRQYVPIAKNVIGNDIATVFYLDRATV
jgi:FkbM family methyltransferase